jgi:hypothetical protein
LIFKMEELNEMREKEYRIRGERLGREHGTASFCPALERMLTPLTDLGGASTFLSVGNPVARTAKGKRRPGTDEEESQEQESPGSYGVWLEPGMRAVSCAILTVYSILPSSLWNP